MAAGGPVHGIHIPLTTTSKTAVAGLNKTAAAVTNVGKAGKRASKAADLHTRASRKNMMAMLEASRGAEDFASQFGTQGWSGALRASANNLTQLSAILSPMAGVIAGVGVAAVALGPTFIKWVDGANKSSEAFKNVVTSLGQLSRAAASTHKMLDFDFSFRRPTSDSVTGGIEDISQAMKTQTSDAKFLVDQLATINKALKESSIASSKSFWVQGDLASSLARPTTALASIFDREIQRQESKGLLSGKQIEDAKKRAKDLTLELDKILSKQKLGAEQRKELEQIQPFIDRIEAFEKQHRTNLEYANREETLRQDLQQKTVAALNKAIKKREHSLNTLRAENQEHTRLVMLLQWQRKINDKSLKSKKVEAVIQAKISAINKQVVTANTSARHNQVDLQQLHKRRTELAPEEAAKKVLDLESKKLRLAKLTLSIRQKELQAQTKAAQAFAQHGQVGIARRGSVEAFSAIEQAKRQTVLSKNPQQQELIKINNEIKEIEKKQLELQKKQLTREVASFS